MKVPHGGGTERRQMDWDRIRSQILAGLDVAAEFEGLGVKFSQPDPDSRGWRECHAVGKDQETPSAGVHLATGIYHDFSGGEKSINLFTFAYKHGEFERIIDVFKHYAGKAGIDLGTPETTHRQKLGTLLKDGYFDYLNPDGSIRYRVFRYITVKGRKHFEQRPPDGKGGWKFGDRPMDGVDPIPYRLPELLASDPEADTVYVVEGERKADRLASLNLIATTSHAGSNSTDRTWPKFNPSWFRGRHCVLLPDADDTGNGHMEKVAAWLKGAGAEEIKLVRLPGLGRGEDVLDWLDRGGKVDDLFSLAHEAPEWEPGKQADPDQAADQPALPFRSATVADIRKLLANTRWYWDGWIPTSSTTGIGGLEGTGKTRFAMDLFRRTYLNEPWPDGKPMTLPAGVPSIWVCSDAHQDEIAEMMPEFGLPDEAIHFPTTWEDPYGGTDLDNPETWDAIEETIKELKSTFLFIDTLTSATARDLCDQRTIKPLKTNIAYLCQTYQISVVLLLHLNRQGDVLGRRIKALTRTLLLLECPDQLKPERLRLSVSKTFSRRPKALGLTMGNQGNEYDDSPPEATRKGEGEAQAGQSPRDKARQFIVDKLKERKVYKLMDLLGEFVESGGAEGTFWRARNAMVAAGEMTCEGTPKMIRLIGEVPGNGQPY